MNKQFKASVDNIEVNSSNAYIVEVGNFRFIKDELFPWIDIFVKKNKKIEYLKEIELDEIVQIGDLEDMEVFAMNWYFDNVEIVKGE